MKVNLELTDLDLLVNKAKKISDKNKCDISLALKEAEEELIKSKMKEYETIYIY